MTGRVAGKRIAVIGAGSIGPGLGNGKAAALLFAREGGRVLAVDRDADAAAETCRLVADEGGVAEPFAADVTDPAAAQGVVARAEALWGGLDVVHFNVGISRPGGVAAATPEDWSLVFRVNVDSAFHVARAALPVMERQGGGAFVFVSSVAAIRGGAYAYASYEASKAALQRLARSIALEYAPRNIRANTILPGLIDTPHVTAHLGQGVDPAAMAAGRAAMTPMGRQGSPWDVAEAALFLASDAAGFVTGVELPVDGGLTLAMPRG